MKKADLKEQLIKVISKKDDILSSSFDNPSFLGWLEELNYLLSQIEYPHEIVFRIMDVIEELLLHSEFSKEKIIQLKTRLQVFEKYEIQKL